MILGGWVFLVSEVPLYFEAACPSQDPLQCQANGTKEKSANAPISETKLEAFLDPASRPTVGLQGYLAHKKHPPRRTLQLDYA